MFPTSIRGKLILGFGLLTVITLILGVADHRTIIVQDRAADEMERKSLERTLTDEIYQALVKEANSVRGFLLAGDESMLEAGATARRQYGEASSKLLELTKSENSNALVEDMRQAHDRYLKIADRELQLAKQGKSKEVLELLRQQAVPTFKALEDGIHGLVGQIDNDKKQLQNEQDAEVRNGKLITLSLRAVGAFFGLIMGSIIRRSVTTPSRLPGPVSTDVDLRWWRMKCANLPNERQCQRNRSLR